MQPERLKTLLHLAFTLANMVVAFIDHAVVSKGQHPQRVADNAGNNKVPRRANTVGFPNGREAVPDMAVDATVYDLDTAPPGRLRQVDNGLGQ